MKIHFFGLILSLSCSAVGWAQTSPVGGYDPMCYARCTSGCDAFSQGGANIDVEACYAWCEGQCANDPSQRSMREQSKPQFLNVSVEQTMTPVPDDIKEQSEAR